MIKKVIMKPKQRVRKILNKTYGISVKRKGSKTKHTEVRKAGLLKQIPCCRTGKGLVSGGCRSAGRLLCRIGIVDPHQDFVWLFQCCTGLSQT